MDDQPNLKLLDRDYTKGVVRGHLAPQLTALRSLVNYGVNLIDRAFDEKTEVGMAKLISVGVFLKQIVAMADAVEVLFGEGAMYACYLPARGALEASLCLEYILERDCETRALRFYVGDLRSQLQGARMVIPGTHESEELAKLDQTLGHVADRTGMEAAARELATSIERVLSQPGKQAIDAEFTKRRGKSPYDPKWYTIEKGSSIQSLRGLAKHLVRLAEYEAFYGRSSAIMHAGTYRDHLNVQDGGKTALVPVRHIGDTHHLLRQIFMVTLGSYHQVIRTYASDELPGARDLYNTKWRAAFMEMPELNWEYS